MKKINLHELIKENVKKEKRQERLKEQAKQDEFEKEVQKMYEFLKKGGLVEEAIDRVMHLTSRKGRISFYFHPTKSMGRMPYIYSKDEEQVKKEAVIKLIKNRYNCNSLLDYVNQYFKPRFSKFDLSFIEERYSCWNDFNKNVAVNVNYKIKMRTPIQVIKDFSFTNG